MPYENMETLAAVIKRVTGELGEGAQQHLDGMASLLSVGADDHPDGLVYRLSADADGGPLDEMMRDVAQKYDRIADGYRDIADKLKARQAAIIERMRKRCRRD